VRPTDAALVAGATARLTRFVVTDDMGQWFVKDPIDAQFHPRDGRSARLPVKYHKYVAGLSCPWCIGYWSGVVVLGSYLLTRKHPRSARAWRFIAGTLTLNYVTAHAGIRLGDVDSD
jgi:hypothetical protein